MATIDERVVRMRLDSNQFKSAASGITKTLDSLKEKLQFKNAGAGLDNVTKAANKVNFKGIEAGINAINSKFSTMGVAFMSVVNQITNSAMNAGRQIANSMIQPIQQGFSEYETQLNSVQTILANTKSKGTTIDQVNEALSTLNTYADKTIYNFSEMTRNIGTFTAAGVDLQTSVDSIKGIANLAAMSGSSSAQASQAMYQLSQAIAAGRVSLMDWNSVVNAGMGGEEFQNALKRTAEHFGTNVDAMIQQYGSFRESLTQGGWLTTDVLTETLKQFSGAYTEADLIAQGYSEDQAKAIMDLAKTSEDAATKVKTFTQMVDTTKEALGSGWAQTWQLVFGDFEEARESWTNISTRLSDMISSSADARNAIVSEWAELGGRQELFGTLNDALDTLLSYLTPIKQGFQDVFPSATGQQLYDLTKRIHEFVQNAKLSAEESEALRGAVSKLLRPVKALTDAIFGAAEGFSNFVGGFKGLFNGVVSVADGIGSLIENFMSGIDLAGVFSSALTGMGSALSGIGRLLSYVGVGISTLASALANTISATMQGVANLTAGAGTAAGGIVTTLQTIIMTIPEFAGNVIAAVGDAIKTIFDNWPIQEIVATVQDSLFAVILADIHGFFSASKKEVESGAGIFDKINEVFDRFTNIGDSFVKVLDKATKTLSAMQMSIQANAILKIAAAVGILAISLKTLSEIPLDRLGSSLGGLAGGLVIMGGAGIGMLAILKKMAGDLKGVKQLNDLAKTIQKIAISMVAFAAAIRLLADSMQVMSSLSWEGILKGIVGIGAMAGVLVGVTKLMGKVKGLGKTSLELMVFSAAIALLGNALKSMAALSWEELARGLTGLAASAGVMVASMKLMSKGTKNFIKTTVTLLAFGFAIKTLASSMKAYQDLDISTMAKAGASLIGFMAIIAIFQKSMNMLKISDVVVMAATLIALSQAVQTIGEAMTIYNEIDASAVAKGLAAVGGFILEAVALTKLLGKSSNFAEVAGGLFAISEAVKTFAESAQIMAELSWEEIGKGLVGVGGGLAIMLTAMHKMPENMLQESAGFAIMAFSLKSFTDAIADLGQLSIGQVGTALLALAGGMTVLVIAAKQLQGTMSGSGSMLLIALALSMMAGPLKTLGDMSVGAIAKSLITLAASFTIIGVAAKTLGSMSGQILKTAGTLAVMGAAITVFGIGLTAMVYPIQKLAELTGQQLASGVAGLAGVIGTLFALATAMKTLPDFSVKTVAKVAIMALVIAGIGAVIKQLGELESGAALQAATALTEVLLAASGALFVLGNVPVTGAVKGVATMAIVIAGMAAIVAAMGAIAQIPGAQWLVGEGKAFLQSIGEAIGGFFGGIVGGVVGGAMAGVASALPGLGQSLSDFMTNAQPFFDGVQGIDPSSMEGVKSLASAMLMVTGAGLVDAATSWLTGGSSMVEFGKQISEFAPYMRAYSEAVVGIDTGAVTASATAAQALAEFAKNIPNEGGLLAKITGENDLAAFAQKLVPFGLSMRMYAAAVAGIDTGAVEASATAAKALAEFAKNIPNEGGLLGKIMGENDLGAWGAKLVPFGLSMKMFADSVAGIDTNVVTNAATAGKALAEMAKAIPNTGGLAAFFAGDNDLGDWGPKLSDFGTSMKSFAESVSGIDASAVTNAANAGKALAEMASAIPNSGGLGSLFTGDNDISEWGEKLPLFGTALSAYSASVALVNADAVTASANAAQALVQLQSSLPAIGGLGELFTGTKSFDTLSEQLPKFGMALGMYGAAVSTVNPEAVTASATAAGALVELYKSLPSVNGVVQWWSGAPDLSAFGQGLQQLGLGIGMYGAAVSTVNPETLTASTTAVQTLANIYSGLPSINGVVQWWTGAPDLSAFGQGLVQLGNGVSSFAKSVEGVQPDSITMATSALAVLSTIYSNLPSVNGIVQWWSGAPDLSTFAAGLKPLGEGVKAFSDEVKDVKPKVITAAASSLQVLSDIYANLPAVNGIVQWWSGAPDMESFSNGLKGLGSGLKAYAQEVGGAQVNFEAVSASIEPIRQVANLASSLTGKDFSGVTTFKEAISNAGDLGLTTFNENLGTTAETTKTKLGDIKTAISENATGISTEFTNMKTSISEASTGLGGTVQTEMSNLSSYVSSGGSSTRSALTGLTSAFTSFKSNVSTAMQNTVNSLSTSLSSAQSKIDGYKQPFYDSGKALADNLSRGVSENVKEVKSSFTGKIDGAVSAIRGKRKDFYDAGAWLVQGFIAGMEAWIDRAANRAAAMADAAETSAKAALDENSPSRVFRKIGSFAGEGLVLGMDDMRDSVAKSGMAIGRSATKGLNDSLVKIQSFIDGDRSFTPSITPVLDTTPLLSNTRGIENLLSRSNLGIRSNVRGLEAIRNVVSTNSMLERYQSDLMTSNRDLRNSITDLRGDMSKYASAVESQETAVYIDGKKLASTIAKPMNQQLGIRSRRGSLSRV